jgi:hypothetical protein
MIPAVLLLALGLIVAAVLWLTELEHPPADPGEFDDVRSLQRSIDQRAAMRRITKGQQ